MKMEAPHFKVLLWDMATVRPRKEWSPARCERENPGPHCENSQKSEATAEGREGQARAGNKSKERRKQWGRKQTTQKNS